MREFLTFTRDVWACKDAVITDGAVGAATKIGLDPKFLPCRLLWDTGATHSCISKRMVETLQLNSIGEWSAFNHTGERKTNIYRLTFLLPPTIRIGGIIASESADNPMYDAIIGLDVISQGDFVLSGIGDSRTLSFRVPSGGNILFE